MKHSFIANKSKSRGSKKESSIKLHKRKKISRKSLKGKAWRYFSKYIRLRDALKTTGTLTHVKCITCGRLLEIGFCDAGHFVSRRYSATLFDETNVNTQCRFCNRFLDGNLLEYRRQIVRMYGEGKDIELEDKATELHKFTIEELLDIAEHYKNKNLTNLSKEYKMKVEELIKESNNGRKV